MEYIVIDKQSILDEYTEILKNISLLAIDTEFIRNNNYYPKVSLLQICYKKDFAIIIDCLVGLNLEKLVEIILDKKKVKVFHSARQDIEIFYGFSGKVPTNIFDTQIALLALNNIKDISYEVAVRDMLKIELDKSLKQSNWLKRPLSDKQIIYAAKDAVYLLDLYWSIISLLEKKNRTIYLADAFLELEDQDFYNNRVQREFTKISDDRTIKNLNVVKELLIWREEKAKQLDLSRNIILQMDAIKSVGQKEVITEEEVISILKRYDQRAYSEEIKAIIDKSSTTNTVEIEKKYQLTQSEQNIYQIIRMVLQDYCSKNNINDSLIASKNEIIAFINLKENAEVRFLKGWRYEIFGRDVLDLLNGKKNISIENNTLLLC